MSLLKIANNLLGNFNYVVSITLFLIGLYAVITKPNFIKKLLGLNIMETSVFLFIVSVGTVKGGQAPIMTGVLKGAKFANPIPQALILTGIVVAVSTTALALSLAIGLYKHCGTLEENKLKQMEE